MSIIEQITKDAQNGQIEDWIDAFLRAEGKNVPLADGLKKQERYWVGPEQVPLKRLTRSCGPEEEMEYRVSTDNWIKKTDLLIEHIKSGGELPPLIVQYGKGVFSIRDGNHRYEAYKKFGLKTCWTLIWCDSEEAFEEMKAAAANQYDK